VFGSVRRFGGRSRRRTYASAASLALHVLVLGSMLSWRVASPPGAAGPSQGAGLELALVSAASLGLAAPHAAPMNAMVTSPAPAPPAAEAATAAADAGPSTAAFAPDDAAPRPPAPSQPQTVAWAAEGTSRLAATDDAERRGARETAGGDPRAASALLAQIARCLPPQLRPRMPAQRLVLKIGVDGALGAAPAIDSLIPLLTATERAEADRVVQAALQCGPYRDTPSAGQAVSLTVDFSAIGPVATGTQGGLQ